MVIVLMGVSGVGKTTIGVCLAKELDWTFFDGDDFHPLSNVDKMSKGMALTDEDRRPWLETLNNLIFRVNLQHNNAILACSALKKTYRDQLFEGNAQVSLVYLMGSFELIQTRLRARKGHYMDPNLLKSQFDALEEPENALNVNVSNSPAAIAKEIRERMGL